MKPEGYNIYKDTKRKKNSENSTKAIFSAVLTVVLVGGVIFIGYSLGGPILDQLDSMRNNNSTVNTLESGSDTAIDSIPVYSHSSSDSSGNSSSNKDGLTGSSISSVEAIGKDSSISGNESNDSSTGSQNNIADNAGGNNNNTNANNSNATSGNNNGGNAGSNNTTSNNNNNNNSDFNTDFSNKNDEIINNIDINADYGIFNAYHLGTNDLKDAETLSRAIDGIKGSYTMVVVPLKETGGKLWYKSGVSEAQLAKAVVGTMTLDEIAKVIRDKGYTPSADISTLEDSIFPATYGDAGYTFTDGVTHWFDDSIENGGKPWLSPFTELTRNYLNNIVREIASAGFKTILCSDMKFPSFRDSDIELLGTGVTNTTGLTDLANTLAETAKTNNAQFMVIIPSADIIAGTADVLEPGLSENVKIAPSMTLVDLEGRQYERCKEILNIVAGQSMGLKIVPYIRAGGTDASEAVRACTELGYTDYMVR